MGCARQQQKRDAKAVTDMLLMLLVTGVITLALTINIAAAIGWLRRRWRLRRPTTAESEHRQCTQTIGTDKMNERQLMHVVITKYQCDCGKLCWGLADLVEAICQGCGSAFRPVGNEVVEIDREYFVRRAERRSGGEPAKVVKSRQLPPETSDECNRAALDDNAKQHAQAVRNPGRRSVASIAGNKFVGELAEKLVTILKQEPDPDSQRVAIEMLTTRHAWLLGGRTDAVMVAIEIHQHVLKLIEAFEFEEDLTSGA